MTCVYPSIRTSAHDLALEAGDYGRPLLPEGRWLMEIKTSQSIPMWLGSLLSEHRIFPVSFSKYGAEYKEQLRDMSQSVYALVPAGAAQYSKQPIIA